MYSTNGSILPNDETVQVWKKFKKVNMNFSIDDIDDRFHYIRWPLAWSKVKNNMEQIASLDVISNVQILCTINPMNIFYFDQLETWFDDFKNRHDKASVVGTTACYGTWGLDAIPENLRNKVIEKYGADHRIVKLLSTHATIPGKWENLIADMEKLDARRKLSYRETFSEALSYCR